MKKKILSQFLKVTLIAIVITLFMSVIAFYELFKKQVFHDLKSEAEFARYTIDDLSDEKQFDVRVTWIGTDGNVLYDSETETLENHSDRPEYIDAVKTGEGKSVRKSDTLSKRIFYYAMRLEDGTVIRIAKEAESIWTIFMSALPIIIGLTVLLYVMCYFLSKHLTAKLVKPVEELVNNAANPSLVPEYKELVPFVGALKEQREDILRSATMRQEFTANVSHELKTPLTAISGYAELIENGMVSGDDSVRFAGEIRKNSTRLLSLINDIINLSELDDGVKLNLERMDLYEAAKNCVKNLDVAAAKNNVKLMLLGTSSYINADKAMMDEVLYNLCDNAIRYNRPGGAVTLQCGTNDEGHPFLAVADTGIGIAPEEQGKVFERFYRVDKSRSKARGGTGLGLAIVKHAALYHHATLDLSSELGVGTTITVTFPIRQDEPFA